MRAVHYAVRAAKCNAGKCSEFRDEPSAPEALTHGFGQDADGGDRFEEFAMRHAEMLAPPAHLPALGDIDRQGRFRARTRMPAAFDRHGFHGPALRRARMRDGVRRATREELAAIVGVKTADAVLAFFASRP